MFIYRSLSLYSRMDFCSINCALQQKIQHARLSITLGDMCVVCGLSREFRQHNNCIISLMCDDKLCTAALRLCRGGRQPVDIAFCRSDINLVCGQSYAVLLDKYITFTYCCQFLAVQWTDRNGPAGQPISSVFFCIVSCDSLLHLHIKITAHGHAWDAQTFQITIWTMSSKNRPP